MYLLFLVFFLLIPSKANASTYRTSATIISTNLLDGQSAGTITSFVYNLSSKPANSTATISFSQNGSSWYNSSGNLDGTDTLTTGTDNTISLLGLGWSGSNFYYKIIFGGDGEVTPVLDDVTINYAGGASPLTSNTTSYTVTNDTYFTGITDGDNGARIIDGVDNGTGTENTGTIEITDGATLVINSNETLVAGAITLTSGSIAIAEGGILKPGGLAWAPDADGDGYPTTTDIVYVTTDGVSKSSAVRRNLMATLSTVDCDDGEYSATNECGGTTPNGSPCTADIDCISGICGTDSDSDGYFSQSAGHTGICWASSKPYTDCYDANGNARPGQTTCYTSHRGDGSYDYNCDGSSGNCNTCNTLTTPYPGQPYRQCYNNYCWTDPNNTYFTAIICTGGTTTCGASGVSCGSSKPTVCSGACVYSVYKTSSSTSCRVSCR